MTTVFHLMRHAAHDELGRVLSGRSSGVALSPEGRAQARALGRRLAERPIDALLASPQRRARETAEVISGEAGPASELCEELDEIDFGAWSGLPFERLAKDPGWRRWNEERDHARPPGGESMAEVAGRLLSLIDRLRRERLGRTIGLVSHGDVIKAGVCRYLGLPFGHLHRFEISPASVTTLVVGDWGATVIAVNERCSAGDEGL